ncbi:Matrix metalloproteinase-15 [Halocaridina rubra]|uniref:Matrix metalloproteinase-15 n=1 Tax=Halocaridina rubra TaxID=373956 RepID=A0AAN8WKS0_HALRR
MSVYEYFRTNSPTEIYTKIKFKHLQGKMTVTVGSSGVLLNLLMGFLTVGFSRALPVTISRDVPTPAPGLNFTTDAPRQGSTLHAVKFMQQFGYIPKGDGDADFIFTSEALEKAIKRMQKFGNIPQTGVVDNATVDLMSTPRCGLPDVEPEDIEGFSTHVRRKRYILGGEGWRKRRLTYFVANWSPKLWSIENVKKELRRAFDAWSTYSHLQFTEVPDPEADIVIFFASYDHHDGYAFDGPSGILAHAYYPYEFGHYGGDVHFDESEEWTIEPKDEYSGLDFFTVAVHEIGHSLGLSHSPESGSIMFPYYKGYNKNFALDYDDVMAMWELYIKRRLEDDEEYYNSTTTTTTTTQAPTTEDDQLQSDAADDNDDGKVDEGVLSDEPRSSDDNDTYNEYDYNDKNNDDNEDDEHVRYHGDYETVDEHQKRVSGSEDELPFLPTLPPEGDDARRREEDKEEEEKRKREEEEERRKKEEEDEEERHRWEEEIRRREAETRRREEEERRRRHEENDRSTTTPKPPPPVPDLCHGSFDAVAVLRQELFIFKGQYLWRYSDRGSLRPGYPTLIRSLFTDLPSFIKKVDAVYERPTDSSIVFFIGKYYYVHNGDRLIEDSPKSLSELGLPDLYTKIDAAFYWPRAKKTYFFSRNSYFRYDEEAKKMDEGYPRDMMKWNGIPGELDAVFTWTDDASYFLRGYQYWQYDNVKIRPVDGYPQDATHYWANCPLQN